MSIEGYTVTYFRDGDDGLILDFHSYLSDNKTQNSATVCNHLEKLIQHLMKKKNIENRRTSTLRNRWMC